MKKLMILLFLTTMAYSNVIDIEWDENFNKNLILKCDQEDIICKHYFGGYASIPEEMCVDCFSNNANMTFIFKSLGTYITRGEELDISLLWDFLYYEENYITMNYKTPYNLVQSYSPIKMKMKFRKLCGNDYSQEPVLFFERDSLGAISKPLYIYCGSTAYSLDLFEVNEFDGNESVLY